MEALFRTHKYLVEHVTSPVRRELMDEIDWDARLIGIKGSRGVGKTTFLLQYAKEHFGTDRACLYVNLNNLYFTTRTLHDFADEFHKKGGERLLLDQIFKYPGWEEELKRCYDDFPKLKIVFTGSSVMRLKEEGAALSEIVNSYNLRGFSFREYLNLATGETIPSVKLEELLERHEEIAEKICTRIRPLAYFQDYLHHGFYPFFLEKRNFSENLLKTINMMLEVDVLFIKQIELTYLSKVRKLLYLLAVNAPCLPNVSQLSKEIGTSRATVMNYIKYLKDARLINMLYPDGEEFPKKPAMVYLHNTNLIYPLRPGSVDEQGKIETFFYNALHKDNKINKGPKSGLFRVNREWLFRVETEPSASRKQPEPYHAVETAEVGCGKEIPLWMFGLLY